MHLSAPELFVTIFELIKKIIYTENLSG